MASLVLGVVGLFGSVTLLRPVPVGSAGAIGAPALLAAPRSQGPSATCPPADLGCGPVRLADGLLRVPAGTYRLLAHHAVVVLGRWGCGPTALPAVLDRSTGQIWEFARWASPAGHVVARAVARVPGASSLRVRVSANGCDQILAQGPGPAVTLVGVGAAGPERWRA